MGPIFWILMFIMYFAREELMQYIFDKTGINRSEETVLLMHAAYWVFLFYVAFLY